MAALVLNGLMFGFQRFQCLVFRGFNVRISEVLIFGFQRFQFGFQRFQCSVFRGFNIWFSEVNVWFSEV